MHAKKDDPSRGGLWAATVRAGFELAATWGMILCLTPTAAMAQSNDTIFPTANTWWAPCHFSDMVETAYCATDNPRLYVFIESSVEWNTGASNIWSQLLNQYDPTDLAVFWESPPVYSGSSQTDVIYQSRTDLPTGLLGATWCDEAIDFSRCDQHYIAFSSTIPSWATSCHESGHAVGLTHGQHAAPTLSNNATTLECMRTPASGIWTVGALNTQNINNMY